MSELAIAMGKRAAIPRIATSDLGLTTANIVLPREASHIA